MKRDKTGGEATGASSQRTFRGGWGQRAWKDQSRSLGGPAGRLGNSRRQGEDITRKRPWTGAGEAHNSRQAGQRPRSEGALLQACFCKGGRKPLGRKYHHVDPGGRGKSDRG